jgi:hypothetical protein
MNVNHHQSSLQPFRTITWFVTLGTQLCVTFTEIEYTPLVHGVEYPVVYTTA